MLDQIYPLFPQGERIFDLFGGSGEVGLNSDFKKIIYNEKSEPIVNIMRNLDDNFVKEVEDCIKKWNLSKIGKQEFLNLRSFYNQNQNKISNRERAVILYCLITHAFNYQFAFNSKGEYNMPSGYNRSWFSPQLKNKLIKYIQRIKEKNIKFVSHDFNTLNIGNLKLNDFVYCDPPYLITVGAYERDYNCKWSEYKEKELLNFLDIINLKGIKFGLSNVLTHKGKTNEILLEWSKKYNIFHLNKDYKNCNYQTNSRKIQKSDEVYICNY